MKLRIIPVAVFLVLFFALGIGATMAFNLWRTEGSKEPAVYSAGDFVGMANPADIRGSYTFGDIAAAFPVPPEALARAFGVSQDGAAVFQVKELETLYANVSADLEIGTDSVRWFVALYAGLPFEPGERTGMPSSALSELAAAGIPVERLNAARGQALDGGDAGLPAAESATAQAAAPGAANISSAANTAVAANTASATASLETAPAGEARPKESVAAPSEKAIKGSTTFSMLEGWGLARDRVAEILGGEAGPPEAVIRDWLAARGLEFATYKEKLQAALDALD